MPKPKSRNGRFTRMLSRLLRLLRPNPPRDPFAYKPARLRPRPRRPAGSVAVAEPDED